MPRHDMLHKNFWLLQQPQESAACAGAQFLGVQRPVVVGISRFETLLDDGEVFNPWSVFRPYPDRRRQIPWRSICLAVRACRECRRDHDRACRKGRPRLLVLVKIEGAAVVRAEFLYGAWASRLSEGRQAGAKHATENQNIQKCCASRYHLESSLDGRPPQIP
jgi:hypothetical protein